MALVMKGNPGCTAATLSPVSQFTMNLGPDSWKPGPGPATGDLVVLQVRQPSVPPLAGPSGWMASQDGRMFGKVWKDGEQALVRFYARGAPERWEVRGYAIAAGSYELPGISPP